MGPQDSASYLPYQARNSSRVCLARPARLVRRRAPSPWLPFCYTPLFSCSFCAVMATPLLAGIPDLRLSGTAGVTRTFPLRQCDDNNVFPTTKHPSTQHVEPGYANKPANPPSPARARTSRPLHSMRRRRSGRMRRPAQLRARVAVLAVFKKQVTPAYMLGLPTVPVFTGVTGAVNGMPSRPVEPLGKTIDGTGAGGR
ncbi:hypothetical protein B0H11DRAFT_2270333 [Mycena galericulata]|nr:hypothetical protein B0H11DRAFT_2270333 [Mycena galericulata]